MKPTAVLLHRSLWPWPSRCRRRARAERVRAGGRDASRTPCRGGPAAFGRRAGLRTGRARHLARRPRRAAEVSFNAPPAACRARPMRRPDAARRRPRALAAATPAPSPTAAATTRAAASVAGVVLRDAAAPATRCRDAGRAGQHRRARPVARSRRRPANRLPPALKRRWPGVGRIAFNADTRALQQDSAGTAELRGQGTAQPQLARRARAALQLPVRDRPAQRPRARPAPGGLSARRAGAVSCAATSIVPFIVGCRPQM